MPHRFKTCIALLLAAVATCADARHAEAQVAVPEARDSLVGKRLALEKAATDSRRYEAPDGTSFQVGSKHFGELAKAKVADIVASLRHGPELRHLSVYLATRGEIDWLCGAWTMACYDPEAGTIFTLGDSAPVAGIPREVVIAHEYGHHLARHRASRLWPALDMGTKRWATAEGVCDLARRNVVFPGNRSSHYWENPGEAFAQAYAELNFPGSAPWYYSPLLEPDPAALEAIQLDLDSTRPATPVSLRTPDSGTRRTKGLSETPQVMRVPHDGLIRVEVRSAAPARYRIVIGDPSTGQTLATRITRRAEQLRSTYENCGRRRLSIAVERVAGAGSFSASAQRP